MVFDQYSYLIINPISHERDKHDPDKLKQSLFAQLIHNLSWKHSKCKLISPFPKHSDISQTIYNKLYDKIYQHQFKTNPSKECIESEYWVHNLHWKSGLGFMIKNVALELIIAIGHNKTFIYGPNINQWPFKNNKNKNIGMDYYFKPITNCKISSSKQEWRYHDLQKDGDGRFLDKFAKTSFSSILPGIVETNWKWPQYNALLTVAEYFIFSRFTQNTQQIIAKNLETTFLNHLQFEYIINSRNESLLSLTKIEDFIMKKIIAVPIRHSDKCYGKNLDDQKAEMICFELEHYLKIIRLMQIFYINDDELIHILVTTEDSNIIKQLLLNTNNKSFEIIINDNDMRPNTGDPKQWRNKNDTFELIGEDGNDLMISMLTTLQLNLLTKYWIMSPNSNWHLIMELWRKYRQCRYNGYHHLNNNDYTVKVELLSYCPRCNRKSYGRNERVVVFNKVNITFVENNEYIASVLDRICVKLQFFNQMVTCWLTL